MKGKTFFSLLTLSLALSLGLAGCATRAAGSPLQDTPATQLVSEPQVVEWRQFERALSFSYPLGLAAEVEATLVPAVPYDPNQGVPGMALAHPDFAQFYFMNYQGGQEFWLPYPLAGAQILVIPTADFAAFGADLPIAYASQLAALRGLLAEHPELSNLLPAENNGDNLLPFLPRLSAQQMFVALPQYLEFGGGSGIRYLTAFSQDGFVVDPSVFYTFQGLSEDGELYVSATLPVRTGLFPEAYGVNPDPAAFQALLKKTIEQLGAAGEPALSPTLAELDATMRSLQIVK
jgi:hypothetical protein